MGERDRSKFAGGDQAYLRTDQYATSAKLRIRADIHKNFSTSDISWFNWLVPRMAIPAAAEILEIGCGPGWLWDEWSGVLPPSVGIVLTDLSDGMVSEAATRVAATGKFETVVAQQADAQKLPFETDRFDRVVSTHMLYHLPDPEAGVREIARVLAEDGWGIVATNGTRHMRQMWEIRGDVFDIETIDNTLDVFGADIAFPMLRRHFTHVEWQRFDDDLDIDDAEAILAYICSAPPGEDATDAQLVELRREISARFVDGSMTVDKDVGVFICRGPR